MYIIKVVNRKTKWEYFIGLDEMDFYAVKEQKNACKFDSLEQVDAMIDNWLNHDETAYVLELNSNTTKPIKVKYRKSKCRE